MNLVIDNGNTVTKVAIFDNERIVWQDTFSLFTINDIRKITNDHPISKCILSSVGKLQDEVAEWVKQMKQGIYLTNETSVPIKNNYLSNKTLGKDRIAAVVGANLLYPDTNILVIDAGTAITYDIIDESGTYLGGNISAGIELKFNALNTYTQNLPLLDFREPKESFGNDTETAILVGVVNGTKKEIEGFINEYSQKFRNLNIIFTGGYSMLFDNTLKNHIFAEPNLVLIGLNRILEYNG